MSKDYKKIYDTYKFICNNTVNGGDCHGETMCLCQLSESDLKLYYNKSRKDIMIWHEDYTCPKCNLHICGCCYESCPSCRDSKISHK